MEIEVVQWARSALLGTTILQGTVQEVRRRGRQKKGWEDNTSSLIGQVKVFPRPKIIWQKKRLNGGKGLLGPWHPHDDYRISAKIGESRNKWFLETTESWVQNYSKQKEIN